MTAYFRIANWSKFQHYKDRNPPWIKFYNELLDDDDIGCLQDASKAHLFSLWLLASRTDNKIKYDPVWVGKRINATAKVNLEALKDAKFIELIDADSKPLADCGQDAIPETEGETEERQRHINYHLDKFESFMDAYPVPDDPSRINIDTTKTSWRAKMKAGVDPDKLILAATNYEDRFARGWKSREFVMGSRKFLHEGEWKSHLRAKAAPALTPQWEPPEVGE